MCCSPSAYRLSRARESLPYVTCCDKELIYLSQPAGHLPRAPVLARLLKVNWSVHAFLKRPRAEERELSAPSSTQQGLPWTLGSGDFFGVCRAILYVFPCLLYRMSKTWYFIPLFLSFCMRGLCFSGLTHSPGPQAASLLPSAYAVEDIPCFPVFSYPGILSLSTQMLACACQSSVCFWLWFC